MAKEETASVGGERVRRSKAKEKGNELDKRRGKKGKGGGKV